MKLGKLIRERLIDPLRSAQGTPGSIARGGAMGIWIALTPTVGAQMLIVAALAVPLRANLPVAIAMVWVSNPITVIPLYFMFYVMGAVMLGVQTSGYSDFHALLAERIAGLPEVGVVETMLQLGYEVLWPMIVGSVLIATLVAIPIYYLLLALAERRRAARGRAAKPPGEDPPPPEDSAARDASAPGSRLSKSVPSSQESSS